MKHIIVVIAMALLSTQAFAAKSCDELKSEIAAKMDGNGVKGYTLDVVDSAYSGDKKVVGSCEGGAKKIIYSRK